jgi:tetratricopeptide (TPR) repeat protein
MAQPAMNAKIEELRFRLKTDPKSRLFFPLAEELRKAGQLEEAEQVLRTGLTQHTTYLSAWVSLGRVLRDQKKDGESVEALSRALQLDPGNVVAARLLGDAYLTLGDKVEAIKKYKLVHALMPSDGDLETAIETLDREINPPPAPVEAAPVPVEATPLEAAPIPTPMEDSPFDRTMPPFAEGTGDSEPMSLAHEESPFEEPVQEYTASALTVEAPVGMHVEEAPPEGNPKISRLENWLSKVSRKEVGGV